MSSCKILTSPQSNLNQISIQDEDSRLCLFYTKPFLNQISFHTIKRLSQTARDMCKSAHNKRSMGC